MSATAKDTKSKIENHLLGPKYEPWIRDKLVNSIFYQCIDKKQPIEEITLRVIKDGNTLEIHFTGMRLRPADFKSFSQKDFDLIEELCENYDGGNLGQSHFNFAAGMGEPYGYPFLEITLSDHRIERCQELFARLSERFNLPSAVLTDIYDRDLFKVLRASDSAFYKLLNDMTADTMTRGAFEAFVGMAQYSEREDAALGKQRTNDLFYSLAQHCRKIGCIEFALEAYNAIAKDSVYYKKALQGYGIVLQGELDYSGSEQDRLKMAKAICYLMRSTKKGIMQGLQLLNIYAGAGAADYSKSVLPQIKLMDEKSGEDILKSILAAADMHYKLQAAKHELEEAHRKTKVPFTKETPAKPTVITSAATAASTVSTSTTAASASVTAVSTVPVTPTAVTVEPVVSSTIATAVSTAAHK